MPVVQSKRGVPSRHTLLLAKEVNAVTITNIDQPEKNDVDPDFDGTLRLHFLERRKIELAKEIREIDSRIAEIYNKKQ